MKIRTRKLIKAIMLFVTAIGMPIFIIVLSIVYPGNPPIGQALFASITIFFLFIGLALFNYYSTKVIKRQKSIKTKELNSWKMN